MSEDGDMWKDYKKTRQEEKINLFQSAKDELENSNIPGEWRDDNLFMVRKKLWPMVNYWPTTRKWKDLYSNTIYHGNVKAFIRWCFIYINEH